MKKSRSFYNLPLLTLAVIGGLSLSPRLQAQEQCTGALTAADAAVTETVSTQAATVAAMPARKAIVKAELRRMRLRAGKIKPYFISKIEPVTAANLPPQPLSQTEKPAAPVNSSVIPATIVIDHETQKNHEPEAAPTNTDFAELRQEAKSMNDDTTTNYKFMENMSFKSGMFTAIGKETTFVRTLCRYFNMSIARGAYVIETSGYIAAIDPSTRAHQFVGAETNPEIRYAIRLALRDLWFKEHSIPNTSKLAHIEVKTRNRLQYLTKAPDKQKTIELQNIILSDAFKARLAEYAKNNSAIYEEPTSVGDSKGDYMIYRSSPGGSNAPTWIFADDIATPLYEYIFDEFLHQEFGLAFDGRI